MGEKSHDLIDNDHMEEYLPPQILKLLILASQQLYKLV
jgi:hypothetical protein